MPLPGKERTQMKQVMTAKLKLLTTPEQFAVLRQTQLAYRDALNYGSRYAFDHGKTSNKIAIQDGTYYDIRARFRLPAQMACSVARQVGATYKTLWTKVKQNAELRKAGKTKKRYKGLDQAPRYISPTLTYQYGKDYSFKTNQQISILGLSGRVVVSYTSYDKHTDLIQKGASLGAAKLWYDKPRKQFYLLVALELKVADPHPELQTTIVGVDVGIRYLATTATLSNRAHFFSGKRIKARADHLARVRKRLQQKGTRSATRRLVAMSGRERRLKLNQSIISYKAALSGSQAIVVDAHYTSQACPKCGHTSKKNRPDKGLLFVCQQCYYTLHADLVGARNIALRTFLVRQDWVRTGQLSFAPDVSTTEAKAARLSRYAELRWT